MLGMDRVSHVLPSVLQKRGLGQHAEAALVAHQAREWLKERFPSVHTFLTVKRLRDAQLTIIGSHSIALQECQGAVEDLLSYLQKTCPQTKVTDIRLERA